MYATRFDSEDLVTRLLTLLQIFAAAVMAANAKNMLTRVESRWGAKGLRFKLVQVLLRCSGDAWD